MTYQLPDAVDENAFRQWASTGAVPVNTNGLDRSDLPLSPLGGDAVDCFDSVDIRLAASQLLRLHERVAQERGRIEITRDGWDESCVLISRTELESMERALEILSRTEGAAAMRDELLRVRAELRVPAGLSKS